MSRLSRIRISGIGVGFSAGARVLMAVLLCVSVLLGSVPQPVLADQSSDFDSQIADINTKLNALETEKKNIEKNIQSAKSSKEQEQEKRNYFDQQIKITKDELYLLEDRILLMEGKIESKKAEIDVKQGEIDESFELFLKRMRAIYMHDRATLLGLAIGSDSFSTFLTRTDTMTRVADYDRALLANLEEQRASLEDDKKELQRQLEELEEDKEEIEEKKQELDGQLRAADLRIQDIDKMEKEYLADLANNKATQDAMKKELEDIYRKIEWSKNPYIGGEMAWPVPGFSKLTSGYGTRFGGNDFHTGQDISGTSIYGANIVAANSGEVKFVNWTYTAGKGYGIYLIIDHGGGITTLYAHCSNILVSVGDVVARGQPIAQVGSTGWSTGPHLHFEVRINGVATDPMPYISGKS